MNSPARQAGEASIGGEEKSLNEAGPEYDGLPILRSKVWGAEQQDDVPDVEVVNLILRNIREQLAGGGEDIGGLIARARQRNLLPAEVITSSGAPIRVGGIDATVVERRDSFMSETINIARYALVERDYHPYYLDMEMIIHTATEVAIGQMRKGGVEAPVVLEGCAGPGTATKELGEKFPQATVVAFDIDPKCSTILQDRMNKDVHIEDGEDAIGGTLEKFPENVSTNRADIQRIELPDSGAHIIIVNFGFHHLSQWGVLGPGMQNMVDQLLLAEIKNPGCNPKLITGEEHTGEKTYRSYPEAKTGIQGLYGMQTTQVGGEMAELQEQLDRTTDLAAREELEKNIAGFRAVLEDELDHQQQEFRSHERIKRLAGILLDDDRILKIAREMAPKIIQNSKSYVPAEVWPVIVQEGLKLDIIAQEDVPNVTECKISAKELEYVAKQCGLKRANLWGVTVDQGIPNEPGIYVSEFGIDPAKKEELIKDLRKRKPYLFQ